MNPLDKLMSQAQIAFTGVFFILLFAIIILFELGYAHLNDAQQKTFDATLAYLKDAGLVIVGFWFARLRGGGIPDAGPTVTQTTTAPDGSKTSVTSPAHLPLPSITNPIQPVTPAPLTESQK